MEASELIKRYNRGERYFRGVDLRRADLREANLGWADLREANLSGADLREANLGLANFKGADLREANLRGADLSGADLRYADPSGADLGGANFKGAYLGWANLQRAYLCGANLYKANLRWANLQRAYLCGARLEGAFLPSPTMVLLAKWDVVSDELCKDLMVYDAHHHEDPISFLRWVKTNECPYEDVKYQRACNFKERRDLFEMREIKHCFDLMRRLIIEKCANSDWHGSK